MDSGPKTTLEVWKELFNHNAPIAMCVCAAFHYRRTSLRDCSYILSRKKKHKPVVFNFITKPIFLKRKKRFFKLIYTLKNTNPNGSELIEFFNTENNKNAEYLANWIPVSLLNVDRGYKIATKAIALAKYLTDIRHTSLK